MQTDRSTRILLALIAAALWAMLLKPVFAPAPADAARVAPKVMDVNLRQIGGRTVSASDGLPIQGAGVGRPVRVEGGMLGSRPVPVTVNQ